MLQTVRELTAEYRMLPPGGRVLCAVSGGADSMCLLHLLLTLAREGGFQVAAAHYNHRLRGAESDRDADFVAGWCRERGIACRLGAGDVAEEACRRGMGVEETARAMRYAFLEETADELGCGVIATAHTADDNAETVLLHLARGTGLHGLTGIPPVRGRFVRPLLTAARADVERYLVRHGLPHVEDSSNCELTYSRNRVRRQVIPVLEELYPGFAARVGGTIARLRADEEYLRQLAGTALRPAQWSGGQAAIPAAAVAGQPGPVAVRMIRLLLAGLGEWECAAPHLEGVLALCRGDSPSAQMNLPHGLTARREYGRLIIARGSAGLPPLETAPLNFCGLTQPAHSRYACRCRAAVCPEKGPPGVWYLARERLAPDAQLRPRQEGDRISLPRRGGSKSLKKLFIDAKIPRWEREQIPVLADRAGVAAVAGFGPDERRLARPGEAAYELRFIPGKEA